MVSLIARREHEFSYGHRVVGHEGKCKNLHGHNGKVIFYVELIGELDNVGRIVDFSVIKEKLCQWLEDNWDHKMLLWDQDEWFKIIGNGTPGVVPVPFNPTAENMAKYLVEEVGPKVLIDYPSIRLLAVDFYETSKCSVKAMLED
jgi:6-pyruvoyltetrahydropterin/6-carboxytetrahydropterin synthase